MIIERRFCSARNVKKAAFILCAILTVGLCQTASAGNEVVIITSFPKELFETYKQAFETRHPDLTVVVKSKQTSALVAYIRETASRPDADLVWASATDAFAVLKADSLLAGHTLPEHIAKRIPATIGPYPIHDPDGRFFGFALSGYGIMWNVPYLQAHQLKTPAEWSDLTNPIYHSHLSMSAPSRSGTTHLMVESILQTYGWKKGWHMLMALSGNMATITERSFGVPQGVNIGEFGIGLVIDFFALSAIANGFPVQFTYPSATPITPAGIGLVRDGPNPENGIKFIHFLLSEAGQALLFEPQISRLPVIPDLYTQAPEGFPNPFKMEMTNATFSTEVSEPRYGLINSLFDQVVTFRLEGLKATWGAIHRAEAAIYEAQNKGKDVTGAKALIAEARSLASTVPVEESQALDLEITSQFKKKGSLLQAQYETEWDTAAKTNYEKARRLAMQAMD